MAPAFATVSDTASVGSSAVSTTETSAKTKNFEVYHNETAMSKNPVEAGAPVENMKLIDDTSLLRKVTIQSGEYNREERQNIDGMKGNLPNGTAYSLSIVKDGEKSALCLTTTAVADDLKIILEVAPASYTVTANSGRLGENNNLGEDAAPTCSVTGAASVEAGKPMNLVFTPNSGLKISKLNIRTDAASKVEPVSAVNGTVTVDGQSYQIAVANDGKVTVTSQSVVSNVFVTALTEKATVQHNLTVNTDSHITSDVTSKKVDAGSTSKIVLTPDEDYSVYKLVIKDGENTKTVYSHESSAKIGDKEYKLTHGSDGKIEIEIPNASADVSINATSVYGSFYVSIKNDEHINTNYDDIRWLGYGDEATVVMTPDDDYEITYVTITAGDDSVRVSANESRVKVGGKTYRMEKDEDGVVRLYLKDVRTNIQIEPTVRDTDITLTVRTDNGVSCADSGKISITGGDDCTLTFTPVDDHDIRRIKVTCGNEVYEATEDDDELMIDGMRCPLKWQSNGKLVLKLYDINESMTVSVYSDYDGENRYITTKADDHSEITHDADHDTYAKRGEEVNITVKPEIGYEIEEVKISTTKDTVTLDKKTERFTLNDRAFNVTRELDGSWKINFSSLPSSVTISSTAKKSDNKNNAAGNIFTSQSPGMHNAYIAGIGNGMFAPDRSMTRAEAVVMLSRLYYGDAAQAGYTPTFKDTVKNSWYSSYVGWAQKQGLLDNSLEIFRPDAPITRAEFLDLLFRFQKVDPTGYTGNSTKFSDMYGVSARTAAEVAYATNQGWIYGYTDGTFRPGNTIARSEIVAMTNRVVNRVPDKNRITANINTLKTFVDVPAANWAFYDIIEASNSHYFTNNGANGEQWG